MAAIDIVQGPGWIEVYPISTREFGVDAIVIDGATYPPHDALDRITGITYADDIEGYGFDDFENVHDYGDIFWSDNGQQLGIVKRLDLGGYDVRHPIIYFDLGGLPAATWTKVELCCDLNGDTEFWDDDGYDLVADYHDTYDVYEEGLGELVTDEDAIGPEGLSASVLPPITVSELAASADGTGPHTWPDQYHVFGPSTAESHAFPLRDDGGFAPGKLRGIRLYLNGGVPTGTNNLIGNYWYGPYDDMAADQSTLREALNALPHLRLWYGLEAAADVSLDLTLEARVENPLRQITEHQARQRRGW